MKVRASRAYIAGLGTAGSLVAGAALLFVLASAVVSFRGWPQVSDQPPTSSVVVNAAHAARASAITRRVAAAVATRRPAVPARRTPAGSRTAPRATTRILTARQISTTHAVPG